MKRFKQIDCIVQVLLIVGSLLTYFMQASNGVIDGFIVYFVVGGWQLLSAVVHLFNKTYNRVLLRRIYWSTVIALIAGSVFASVNDNRLLTYLYMMLFLTPALTLYYCTICMIETRSIAAANTATTG
jgi:hypothetical protein